MFPAKQIYRLLSSGADNWGVSGAHRITRNDPSSFSERGRTLLSRMGAQICPQAFASKKTDAEFPRLRCQNVLWLRCIFSVGIKGRREADRHLAQKTWIIHFVLLELTLLLQSFLQLLKSPTRSCVFKKDKLLVISLYKPFSEKVAESQLQVDHERDATDTPALKPADIDDVMTALTRWMLCWRAIRFSGFSRLSQSSPRICRPRMS